MILVDVVAHQLAVYGDVIAAHTLVHILYVQSLDGIRKVRGSGGKHRVLAQGW
jgi:hypothetical protein